MKAIVAVYHGENDNQWGIGKDGTQPIVLKVDRKFFRKTTENNPVIVGYKTLQDFPNAAPLPNRLNIILTRKQITIPGALVADSIETLDIDALNNAFVIGGASVYNQMLKYCNEIYVTHIYADINPDVFFPVLNDSEWTETIVETGEENNIKYKISKYDRKES